MSGRGDAGPLQGRMPTQDASRVAQEHACAVLAHVDAAKERRSGRDLAGMDAEELIADLLAHRQPS